MELFAWQKFIHFFCLILLASSALADAEIGKESAVRQKILKDIFKNYKKHDKPNEHSVTEVDVNMKILAIFSIDVLTMDYFIDAYLRMRWVDPRLTWNNDSGIEQVVSPQLKDKVWLPDLFFRNGKKGYLHTISQPNYLMRLMHNGTLTFSQKITMRYSCQMNLKTFPMDNQNCKIDIGSYAYQKNELNFIWDRSKKDGRKIELDTGELEISEFSSLKPEDFITTECGTTTGTGEYSCIEAKFVLRRQIGFYLATTYIPNILIIIVSWLSFWVSVDAAPARVPLGLLSLLGILTQANSLSSSLPRVSYIKAIDIWLIFSIIFVIGVLVEYAIALTVVRAKKANLWHREVREIVHQELVTWCSACQQQQLLEMNQQPGYQPGLDAPNFCDSLEGLITQHVVDKNDKSKVAVKPPSSTESEVDRYSRFLFPACYLLYNFFYWIYYLYLVNFIETDNLNQTNKR
ncbi:hypothetical protein Ciccas_004031 [Cichlidogyrus casuarinus]|uniref:Uncharacterized protein n=1 Tax=Cichlidogyrus casuarinus TaxID=1844966 RepID=A0ABD2QEZ5_9PLAT